MKHIVVTHCLDPLMWYAKLIGQRFVLIRDDTEYYWVREPTGYLNIVHKSEATVCED
jgi:hypothetical protein